MALQRLHKEFMGLIRNPVPFGTVSQTDNPFVFTAHLKGPECTPYEGGVFQIELTFTVNYPTKPPQIMFKTKIFHANIGNDGGVCTTLFNDWRPTDTITTVLLTLNNLLSTPNRNSTLNSSTRSYSEEVYEQKAKEWTQEYAKQN